jgi:Rad3-related DNA helicase
LAILAKVADTSATLEVFDDFRALLNQNAGKSTLCAAW